MSPCGHKEESTDSTYTQELAAHDAWADEEVDPKLELMEGNDDDE